MCNRLHTKHSCNCKYFLIFIYYIITGMLNHYTAQLYVNNLKFMATQNAYNYKTWINLINILSPFKL